MNVPDYEDIEIIKQSLKHLAKDHFITFCMVGRTWGSSPRPAGSLLVISQHGIISGSVSGGCIEEDLLLKYKSGVFDHGDICILTYDTNNAETAHINIPCESVLEIIVERIYDSAQLKAIYDSLCKGKAISRITDINQSTSSIKPASATDTGFFYDAKQIKRIFGPSWSIIITGANDVSFYVAAMGRMLGYNIIICEPRDAFISSCPPLLCQNYEITRLMPDDAVRHYATHFSSVVLALSHDPKLDDMALLAALELDLFYVGAIGSKKNNEKRRLRLSELGLNDDAIAKLHGPVGLNIRSKVPAEISVSIFAELIKLRNN